MAKAPPAPIAVLTNEFPPDHGELAAMLANLLPRLAARLPLKVFALSLDEGLRKRTGDFQGIPVTQLGAHNCALLQQQAFRMLRDQGPFRAIVGFGAAQVGFLTSVTARYLDIPSVLVAWGDDLDREPFVPDQQAALLHALGHVDRVAGVSQDLCRMAKALGVKKPLQISPSVDGQRYRPGKGDAELRPVLGMDGRSFPIIGYFGLAEPGKGLTLLLQATAALLKRFPNTKLLLVGDVSEAGQPVLEKAQQTLPPLRNAIIQAGWQNEQDLPAYYSLLDLFWYPVMSSGLSEAILQAMASGVPVIAGDLGGANDILAESPLAPYRVAPVTAENLARRSLELLGKSVLERQKLGEASRTWVEKKFSPETELAAYLKMLKGVGVS